MNSPTAYSRHTTNSILNTQGRESSDIRQFLSTGPRQLYLFFQTIMLPGTWYLYCSQLAPFEHKMLNDVKITKFSSYFKSVYIYMSRSPCCALVDLPGNRFFRKHSSPKTSMGSYHQVPDHANLGSGPPPALLLGGFRLFTQNQSAFSAFC